MCGDVRSERASPAASVRSPLGGLGAIVGAIADMRGMDGGIWHERKGEHGKGAFLGEATVQSKSLNAWSLHARDFIQAVLVCLHKLKKRAQKYRLCARYQL